MLDFYGFHVGKYTIHGWYGNIIYQTLFPPINRWLMMNSFIFLKLKFSLLESFTCRRVLHLWLSECCELRCHNSICCLSCLLVKVFRLKNQIDMSENLGARWYCLMDSKFNYLIIQGCSGNTPILQSSSATLFLLKASSVDPEPVFCCIVKPCHWRNTLCVFLSSGFCSVLGKGLSATHLVAAIRWP